MTVQVQDRVTLDAQEYAIVGVNGTGFFDPTQYGIKLNHGADSSCWRGFSCIYAIVEKRLTLDTLWVYIDWDEGGRDPEGPELFGKKGLRYVWEIKKPKLFGGWKIKKRLSRDFKYEGLNAPVPFTGGLLLGADPIENILLGNEMPYGHRNVREVILNTGRVVQEYDRSDQMAEVRDKAATQPCGDRLVDAFRQMNALLEGCFQLKYNRLDL